MIDLLPVALGFGILPFLAAFLYAFRDTIRRNESAAWGLAAGVVAFLGLAHAGSALLEGNAFLKYEASPWVSALVAVSGLSVGIFLAAKLLGRVASVGGLNSRTFLLATVAFVAVHSFTDGLVLGEAYAGPAATGVSLDLASVAGTVLHRFAEGYLIVLASVAATWRPPRSAALLLAGLVTVPAAYVPVAILSPASISPSAVALDQAISVFGAGLEAGFAILFLALGVLPRFPDAKDARWAVWMGIGFTLLLLVHFLVE